MPGRLRTGSATTRRRFLTTLASASAAAITSPAFSLSPQRPLVTHGVQSGDVSLDSGMVWARADRPARMFIEAATTDTFKETYHASFADALPETDFTAKYWLRICHPGRTFSTGCGSRICGRHKLSASRSSGVFARLRSIDVLFHSYGLATLRVRAGVSIRRAVECAHTERCCTIGRTSLSIAATAFTRTVLCPHNKSCRAARRGEMS